MRIFNGASVRVLVGLALFLLVVFVDLSAGSSSSSSSDIVKTSPAPHIASSNDNTSRSTLVRNLLAQRLEYVQSGKRTRDFGKWVKERRGDATIFSMHGSATNEMPDFTHPIDVNGDDTKNGIGWGLFHRKRNRRVNPNDPFPPNRMNLDLVLVTDKDKDDQQGTTALFSSQQQQQQQQQHFNVIQLLLRAAKLGIHFCPVLSTCGLALVSQRFRQQVWYAWLTRCIGSAGAAWIKWGQWSSTRNDMFPEALCDALATLHNDAPAHDWDYSQKTVEDSLGISTGSLSDVFDEFEQQPLASGSIAQVHKAVLCGGHLVAVKIRHPRVAQLIAMDFTLMSAMARLFDACVPGFRWLHVRDSIDQFSHTMAAQSDLHVEAHHLEVLHHNFRQWPHVRFPQPIHASAACIIETFEAGRIVTGFIEMYEQLAQALKAEFNSIRGSCGGGGGSSTSSGSTKVVIVNEHGQVDGNVDDGTTSSDNAVATTTTTTTTTTAMQMVEDIQARELIPIDIAKFLVTTGVGVYLKMLLVDNLMHADLHPGNIMINFHRKTPQNAKHNNQETLAMVPHDPYVSSRHLGRLLGICLVDAGMVAQLTDDESSSFIGLFSSVGEGNGKEAAEFALQFSLENNMDESERALFVQDMDELFAERCRGYGTNVNVGYVLRGVLGLIRKHRVRIDANFATLVVNCLCVESLGRQVCPNYNVLDAAEPLLRGYRKLCYNADGTPKPKARKSKFVKMWLSLMYIKKNIADDAFFRREAKRNREKRRSQRVLLEL